MYYYETYKNVEMVTEEQAKQVRAAGVKGITFSDTKQFNDWLCEDV
jgi:hypothetical protein